MSTPLPKATVTGIVRCGLCGQVAIRAVTSGITIIDMMKLLRAHQRSEVCS